MNEGDGGFFGGGNGPASAEKVDLVVGVDPPSQVESQMEVQERYRRTGTGSRAFFGQGLCPSRIRAEEGSAADRGILSFTFLVEDDLRRGVIAYLFISQDCHQTLLQSAKAAFDLALGLWTGGD
jgi:hypothetical protein